MKFALLKLFSHFLNLLPNRIVMLMGDALGLVWYYILPFRKNVIKANIQTAFGDTMGPKEVDALAKRNLRHMGKVVFESVRSVVWDAAAFRKNIRFHGFEHFAPYLKERKGGFVLSLHTGCWEIEPGSGAAQGIPVDIVAKYARKAGAEPILQWFRQRLGINVLPETRSTQMILDSIAQGRWVGFMMDQFMGPPAGIPVTFFGKTAGTTASVPAMIERNNIPTVLGVTHRNAEGYTEVTIEKINYPEMTGDLTERIWQRTQFLNDLLESKVRMYPDQWLWLHRRWKPFNGTPKWNLSEEKMQWILSLSKRSAPSES